MIILILNMKKEDSDMKELQAILNALIDFYNTNIIGWLIKLVGDNDGIIRFLESLVLKALDFVK